MTQLSGDRSDMVPALGWLCPIAVGQWPGVNGIIDWQIINGSQSFTGPLRAIWQASGLNHRNVSKYIFSNGYTTVFLTHLTVSHWHQLIPSCSIMDCTIKTLGMDYIDIRWRDVIIHPCHNFYRDSFKSLLKPMHGWDIAFSMLPWVYLISMCR